MESRQITSSRAEKYAKTNKKASNDKPKKTSKANKGLRTLIILSVIAIFIVGTVIGYSIVGEGEISDVFRLETWIHLYKLVFG